MKDYEKKYYRTIALSLNNYLFDSWDQYIKKNPKATMANTNVGEFITYLDKQQSIYLKKLK